MDKVEREVPAFLQKVEVRDRQDSFARAEKEDSVATEAISIVYGPRQAQYGESIDNHDRIAAIANAIAPLDSPTVYCAADIGRIMLAVKLSRLQSDPSHRDSYVDLIGYAEILHRITQRDKELLNKGGAE